MSTVVGGLADTLATLASEVGELEERAEELQEQLQEARSREVSDEEWAVLQSSQAVYEKLADLQRGIATLDEVFEAAGL